jgi:hypothetical protein
MGNAARHQEEGTRVTAHDLAFHGEVDLTVEDEPALFKSSVDMQWRARVVRGSVVFDDGEAFSTVVGHAFQQEAVRTNGEIPAFAGAEHYRFTVTAHHISPSLTPRR